MSWYDSLLSEQNFKGHPLHINLNIDSPRQVQRNIARLARLLRVREKSKGTEEGDREIAARQVALERLGFNIPDTSEQAYAMLEKINVEE